MRVHVDIGGSEALELKGALLVYQGHCRSFVSWHEARAATEPGAPYLGEATPVSMEFVRQLSEGLGTHLPVEVLPENVLVRTPETMVWWTPARRKTMFFADHDPDGARLSGHTFPQPPLVWRVTAKDLWVRALATNRRPVATSKLMVAPFWNVDGETGWTCQGSMRSPDIDGVVAIPDWERAFYGSEFTHQTGVRRLTKHPGGFFALWSELSNSEGTFPRVHLVPAGETLHEFITRER
jgi:PRTRC genetic system protein B